METFATTDPRHAAVTLRNLTRLWRESGDEELPPAVAAVLNLDVKEVTKLLESMKDETTFLVTRNS